MLRDPHHHRAALVLAVAMLAAPAPADQYIMGAGGWTCGEVNRVVEEGTENEIGQLVGWVLGFWSGATFDRDDAFVDLVEQVGGQRIFDATLSECAGADPEMPLFRVAELMVQNSE